MFDGFWIKIIAAVAIFAALSFSVWHFAAYHENIGYQRAYTEYQASLIKAASAARIAEKSMQERVDTAEKKGAEREKIHKVEIAVLDSTNRRLRNDIADFRKHLPDLAGPACVEAADTAAELFGECADQYRALAEAADGHASDAQTLSDAWPK